MLTTVAGEACLAKTVRYVGPRAPIGPGRYFGLGIPARLEGELFGEAGEVSVIRSATAAAQVILQQPPWLRFIAVLYLEV